MKKRRVQPGLAEPEAADPFINQIRQAIIDERTDRYEDQEQPSRVEKPEKVVKEGDSYAKEDLRDWGTYEENF